MAKNDGAVRDGRGNLLCYLDKCNNGGIDLYDEYNKGIDKIIDAFKGCSEKQKTVASGGQGKQAALMQNEQEKQKELLKLRGQRDDETAQINNAIAGLNQRIEDEERKFDEFVEEQGRTVGEQNKSLEASAQREKEGILDEYKESIVRKRQKGAVILGAYEAAQNNLERERQRLQSDLASHKERVGQINHKISELEKNKKSLRSDESIEREVESYRAGTCEERGDALAREYAVSVAEAWMPFEEIRSRERSLEENVRKAEDQADAKAVLDRAIARLEPEAEALGVSVSAAPPDSGSFMEIYSNRYFLPDFEGGHIGCALPLDKKDKYHIRPINEKDINYIIRQMEEDEDRKQIVKWLREGGHSRINQFFTSNQLINGASSSSFFWPPDFCFFGIRFRNEYCEDGCRAREDKVRKKGEAYLLEEKERAQAAILQAENALKNSKEMEETYYSKRQQAYDAGIKEFKAKEVPRLLEERRKQLLSERKSASDWNLQLEGEISKEKSNLQREQQEVAQKENQERRLSRWASVLGEDHAQSRRRIDQSVDQSIKVLGEYSRIYLKYDDRQIEETERRIKHEWMSSEPSDYSGKKFGMIDWVHTDEQGLQEQYEEAKEELDALWKKQEEEASSKEAECARKLKEADQSCQEKKGPVAAEADRKKEEAKKKRDDEIEKLKLAINDNEEKEASTRALWEQKIKEAENAYQEKAKQIGEDWDEKIKRSDAEYKEGLDSLLGKLEEDGLAEICGFNYKNAWRIFHGMATSTIAFPLVDKDDDDLLLKGLTAKSASADFDHCYFMPGHMMWGYSPADLSGLTPEIRGKIQDVLRRGEEFGGKGGWNSTGDIEKYHLEETPVDIFYKLDCTPVQDGSAMIFYDLGDLEKDEEKRNRLMEFIQRVFLFDMQQCVWSDSYLNIDVISTRYDEYFTDSSVTDYWGGEVAKDMASAKKKIGELRRDREGLTLGNGENLHEKNRKRSEAGRNPADRYEALIVVNTDYKGLADTDLGALLRISARRGVGMYTFLFVDMDRIGRMERPDGERDALQGFLNDINREGSFYEIREQDARLTLRNIGKGEAASKI